MSTLTRNVTHSIIVMIQNYIMIKLSLFLGLSSKAQSFKILLVFRF